MAGEAPIALEVLDALQTGIEQLGVRVGLVAIREDAGLRVVHARGPAPEAPPAGTLLEERDGDVPPVGPVWVEGLRLGGGAGRLIFGPWSPGRAPTAAERNLVRFVARSIDGVYDREALRAERDRSTSHFHLLWDSSPDAVYLHRDGRFLEVNPASAAMLRIDDPATLRGRALWEFLVPGPETEEVKRRIGRLAAGQSPGGPIELEVRAVDGTRLVIETYGAPVELADGRAALTVGRDVTERKRAQQRMLDQAERLASIGTLAASVAHELNNPLATVLANVELALEDAPAATAPLLEEARDAALRARHVLRELAHHARASDESRAPRDLRDLLEAAVGMVLNTVRHRARLTKDYGAVPLVEADEVRLTQVFVNLLLHAAWSLPETASGDREIAVRTHTDADGRAVVTVIDDGPGLPDDVADRLFDAFVPVPGPLGVGLGLATCRRTVRAHGGQIEAANRTDRSGTVFRVVLPPAVPAKVADPAPRPVGAGVRGRVLVIDDDPMVARSVFRVLSRNHDVSVVHDGADALRQLAEPPAFDAIVCDLMIPGMPGWQIHERVRATDPSLADRMLFVTGGSLETTGDRFLDRIPNPRLGKPFDVTALREAVDQIVAAHHGRGGRRASES